MIERKKLRKNKKKGHTHRRRQYTHITHNKKRYRLYDVCISNNYEINDITVFEANLDFLHERSFFKIRKKKSKTEPK